MNRTNLLVSHVLIAAIGVSVGYGLSLMVRPDVQRTPEPSAGQTTWADQSTQNPLSSPDTPSDQTGQLTQTQQIASLQAQLNEAKEDLEVAEELLSGELPESGSARTPEEKVAAYRKLWQDPDVQKAMMTEYRKVNEDPDVQQAERERLELSGKHFFRELFSKLGMADDQRDEFLRLWADGQKLQMEVQMEMAAQTNLPAGESGEERLAAAQARITTIREQTHQKIGDLLGTEFEVYEQYAETMLERSMINKMSYDGQEPLDDYTTEALLRIIGEEKAAAGTTDTLWGMVFSDATLQSQKDALARSRVQNANVIERATSYLTEGQHATLVELLNTREKQSENVIKYWEASTEAREQKENEGEQD